MRKIFSILTVVFVFSTQIARADEGMWIPMLLQANEHDMQAMGMRITAEDIYSINHGSLKDAIVKFGSGCTGEIVSAQGLLFTNHHCGFGSIQRHSSIEHDYLTEGFWSMSMDEELPCPWLTVTLMKKMENVTEQVLAGVSDETSEEERAQIVKENIASLKEKAAAESGYDIQIVPFYLGNEYYMFYNEIFKDIRFVGAPPSNIGKFGGDTDNWVWPRHTGDFSVFRIYVGPDGKPAKYSPENKPYSPEKFLPISIKGVEEGDFTFVFGYPGHTNEYFVSTAVAQESDVIYPIATDLRGQILNIYNKYQEQDPQVRIQYASKHAGIGNGWKKWIGVTEGIARFKGIEKKQAFETEFLAWCTQKPERKMYSDAVNDLKNIYNANEPYRVAYTYLAEAGLSIELLNFVAGLNLSEDFDKEKLSAAGEAFFKDYYQPIDREVAVAMLSAYREHQSETFLPEIFNLINKKYKGDVKAYVNHLFDKSVFASKEKYDEFVAKLKPSNIKKINKDEAVKAVQSLLDFYHESIMPNMKLNNAKIQKLNRIYMKGQMEMLAETRPNKAVYPDANLTLRVTYGKVGGFKPKDGMWYQHFTTLDGIMQKENPEIYDYVVTDRLRELYNKKDYGRYVDADGSMHVAFIAGNHTTGGNSGSPILNADGHLIGLNFDRTWEGTMSDFVYDPSICKNISVDVRYVLFIIDKYAGCKRLIDEMVIVEE